MAFASSMVWEVRTTGSDGTSGNGGGFDPTSGVPGSDYSRQDSPQVTYSDLVIDGTTNTKCTSAANPFTSAHVGNVIAISSGTGFTVQRVQILSVAAAAATCDKSLGTLASTGGVGKLGGALASPGMAASLKVASNKVWIKSGTYACSSSSNVSGGRVLDATTGTNVAPNRWEGYQTTRGDRTGTRPLLNSGANSMTIFSVTGVYGLVENINVGNGAAHTSVIGFAIGGGTGGPTTLVDCTATGIGVGFLPGGANTADRCIRCRASSCGTGFNVSGWAKSFLRCTAESVTNGFLSTASNTHFAGCLVSNSSVGFSVSSTAVYPVLLGCTSDLSTGAGFYLGPGAWAENCLATRSLGYGYEAIAAYVDTMRLVRCAGWSNATANYDPNFVGGMLEGFVACSADPYVDKATGDYRPNTTSGGGAALRGAGSPQSLPGYAAASAPDIGAYQHADAASGGGVSRSRIMGGG